MAQSKKQSRTRISVKQLQIDKANSTTVIAIAVAAFLVVFSMIATKALWETMSFQNRVIDKKEVAVAQLEENIATIDDLVNAYTVFTETPDNVIGGNPNGNGERDGDNAKIVLDALPSKYDFPALTTSLEKILSGGNYTVDGISGTDDEVAQGSLDVAVPEPVEIPFNVSALGNFNSIEDLLVTFQNSIRPVKMQQISINGSNAELRLSASAITYYQPEKALKIQTEVVR